ncbi:hypothetical protein [Pseudomonas sp. PMCC200344]|uniref:hypothetical protein n=1 Tax=Pseudomonas sp. PMCC200344 TaxID=3042028 RepID=UPI0024B3956E|nr:hypothetical protein [Pseudomonas sp. PMCC200344]
MHLILSIDCLIGMRRSQCFFTRALAERSLTIAAMPGLGAWITQVIAANKEPITQPLPIDGRGPVIARIARVPFEAENTC